LPIPLVELSHREIARRIEKRIRGVKEIGKCKVVSITSTRKKPSVHLNVVLKGNPNFEEAHAICSEAGTQVRHVLSNVDISILSESGGTKRQEGIVGSIVNAIAEGEPGLRGTQNIHVRQDNDKVGVDFILLRGSNLTATETMPTSELQKRLLVAHPQISEVVIHEEYISDLVRAERSGQGAEIRWYVEHVGWRFPELGLQGPPAIRKIGDQFQVSVRVSFVSGTNGYEEASESLLKFTAAIRNGYPAITGVDVIKGIR